LKRLTQKLIERRYEDDFMQHTCCQTPTLDNRPIKKNNPKRPNNPGAPRQGNGAKQGGNANNKAMRLNLVTVAQQTEATPLQKLM